VAGASGGTSGIAANMLSCPYGLTMDSSNSLYIPDYSNNRIQRWMANASTGTTVSGQSNGASGASSTALFQPVGIVLDSSDNMYFTDRGNHRVVFWDNGASNGTTIAGITGKKSGKRYF
jgi:sugar lactone lactonase YvrE